MKASALSAAIPILGRSAEDPKQMKRGTHSGSYFALALYIDSICQNLHRLRSTSRQSRRPGPAPSRSPPGEDAAEDREVQGDLSSSNRSYPNELWQILDVYVGS